MLGHTKNMDNETMNVHNVQQIIDGLWLEELKMQISGELFNTIIECAKSIENGMDRFEMIREAQVKVDTLRSSSLQSLKDRFLNRNAITLDGGLEHIERAVLDQYAESLQYIAPLLQQLSSLEEPAKVKAIAMKQVLLLQAEMDSVNIIKEANTWTMLDLDEVVEQVEGEAMAFMRAVQQAASANPGSTSLQQRAIRVVSKAAEARAKRASIDVWGRQRRAQKSEDPDLEKFVLETMRTLGHDNASVLVHGFSAIGFDCQAISSSGSCSRWHTSNEQQFRDRVNSIVRCVADGMKSHLAEAVVQERALFALLALAEQSAETKMLVARTGVIERVLEAVDRHPMDARVQQQGKTLLGILVLAGSIHKAQLHDDTFDMSETQYFCTWLR